MSSPDGNLQAATAASQEPDRDVHVAHGRPERRMLRIKEAAAYCGVSAHRMRRLAVEGQVAAFRPTDSPVSPYIFDSRDLETWIASRKQRTPVVAEPAPPPKAELYGGTLKLHPSHGRSVTR